MKAAIAIVLLAAGTAAADPDLVVTARGGLAHFEYVDPQADSDLPGDGFTVGAQVGAYFRALHLEPAIGVDLAQYEGGGHDVFEGDYTTRVRTLSVSARLRVELTPWLDLTASAGPTLFQFSSQGESGDSHDGWHYGLAAGVRVWHCAQQAVRVELAARSTTYTIDDNVTMTQVGASVAYAWTF